MTAISETEVEVVSYEPKYASAFYQINKAWIDQYFTMEPKDYEALEQPETHIIAPGGTILIALVKKSPAGVCALIPSSRPGCMFELAKMGVDKAFRGQGIGRILCINALKTAQRMGARKVYLESNTILTPALNLYRSLGFVEVVGGSSPYSRSNIQMEITL